MATRFLTATPSDVIAWAMELHSVATAMARAAGTAAPAPVADAPKQAPTANAPMPEALRQRMLQR
jgi:hypothetical protein